MLGERRKHAPRHLIAATSQHVLIDGEQLHDVIAWLEQRAEPRVVGEVDEIDTGRDLDRAEHHPRGLELGRRAVDRMDEGRAELSDLVGEDADIAACIEHALAAIVDLTGKKVIEPLRPRPADPRAKNRLCRTLHCVVHAGDMGRASRITKTARPICARPLREAAMRGISRGVATFSVVAVFALAAALPAVAKIECQGNFQVTEKYGLIATPYCEEENIARVARSYGIKVTGAEAGRP